MDTNEEANNVKPIDQAEHVCQNHESTSMFLFGLSPTRQVQNKSDIGELSSSVRALTVFGNAEGKQYEGDIPNGGDVQDEKNRNELSARDCQDGNLVEAKEPKQDDMPHKQDQVHQKISTTEKDAEPNPNDENIRAEDPSHEEDDEPDFEPEDDSDSFSVHSDLKDIMLSPDEISALEDANFNDFPLTPKNVSYTDPSPHDLMVRELAEKETEFYVLAAGIAVGESFESILEEDRKCRELLAKKRVDVEKEDCVTSHSVDRGHGGDDNCSIEKEGKRFKKLGDSIKADTQETSQAPTLSGTPEPSISNSFDNEVSGTHSHETPEHSHDSINNLQLLDVVITELQELANDLASIKASTANKYDRDSGDQIINDWVLVERAMSPSNGTNLIHADCQLSTTPKDGLRHFIDHIGADNSIPRAELTINGKETAYSLWYGNLLDRKEDELFAREEALTAKQDRFKATIAKMRKLKEHLEN